MGAGPTGLALACGLASQGVAVRVVDGKPEPASTSRANILHARGVEVLDRLGALGDLPGRALAPLGMAMHAGGRRVATMRFAPAEGGRSTQALFVSQALVEESLRRRLGELGVKVGWGTRLQAAGQDRDGVTVRFADGTRLRAGWLAGCDGARSTVRDAAGIAFPGVPVVERFLLADVHARWDRDRSASAGWFHRDGILLAIPMRPGERLWRLMADVPADRSGDRLGEEEIVERFRRIVPERSGDTGVEIVDAVWTSVFRIQRRLAAGYRAGRILLAGDAAHVHSPIGGQGMNTGVGDAENLAWKLALVVAGRAAPELLDTYTAERRPLATEVLRNTTANTRVLTAEGGLGRLVRDRAFIPLLNLPAVQRQATRTASQLGVTYRKGPLGDGRRLPRRGPRAGDPVPDGPYRLADGAPARLHATLGAGWALIAPPGGPADRLAATARDLLGDRVVLLHGTGSPYATLVRPDGHLGWRGRDAAGLRQWLTDALRCGR